MSCAFFSLRVHIAVLSGASSYFSLLVECDSWLGVKGQARVGPCYGYDWGCVAGRHDCDVPFDH